MDNKKVCVESVIASLDAQGWTAVGVVVIRRSDSTPGIVWNSAIIESQQAQRAILSFLMDADKKEQIVVGRQ